MRIQKDFIARLGVHLSDQSVLRRFENQSLTVESIIIIGNHYKFKSNSFLKSFQMYQFVDTTVWCICVCVFYESERGMGFLVPFDLPRTMRLRESQRQWVIFFFCFYKSIINISPRNILFLQQRYVRLPEISIHTTKL